MTRAKASCLVENLVFSFIMTNYKAKIDEAGLNMKLTENLYLSDIVAFEIDGILCKELVHMYKE